MKLKSTIVCALLVFGWLSGVRCARADALVQVAPHRGLADPTHAATAPPLLGFLARPTAAGRHPAVVLLHGCNGFTEHDSRAAAMLKSWGYVALALDSLGDANLCSSPGGSMAEVLDAYAALHYLAARDFVAPDRIAVMGYSMGGSAVLDSVERGAFEQAQTRHFRAAVAYYPNCQSSSGVMTTPTLILIGDKDDWNTAKACQTMAAHQSGIGITRSSLGDGVPVTLVIYPDATHAFDGHYPEHHYLGHLIRHDPAATHDAELRVRAFLQANLAAIPTDQAVKPAR